MSIHHPHPFTTSTHHSQAFPIHFPHFPNVLQDGFVLLQNCQNTQEKNRFYHILKILHPLVELFHAKIHIDDGNMLKEFKQILVHTFLEIGRHHLHPFLILLEVCASVGREILWVDA